VRIAAPTASKRKTDAMLVIADKPPLAQAAPSSGIRTELARSGGAAMNDDRTAALAAFVQEIYDQCGGDWEKGRRRHG
jgi:hypothetical protein